MHASPEVTRDCLDMRAAIEREGARRFLFYEMPFPVGSLRASHLAMLERALKKDANTTSAEAIEVDLSLHDALANGLANPFLRKCYDENRDRIAVIQNTRPFLQDRIVSAMGEHLEIIAAMEERDLQRVEAAIDHHLASSLRWRGVS